MKIGKRSRKEFIGKDLINIDSFMNEIGRF